MANSLWPMARFIKRHEILHLGRSEPLAMSHRL